MNKGLNIHKDPLGAAGATGSQGPQGPAGAIGAQGPAGPQSLVDKLYVKFGDVVTGITINQAAIQCNPGDIILTGSFYARNEAVPGQLRLVESRPFIDNSA